MPSKRLHSIRPLSIANSAAQSAHQKLTSTQVAVTNGVDEAILLTALALLEPNQAVVTTRSTFLAYRAAAVAAKVKNCEVDIRDFKIPVGDILQATCAHQPRIVFICNPHNPTGTVLGHKEIKEIVREAKKNNTILVVDDAYAEFADPEKFCSAKPFVDNGDPVLMIKTFSKAYGLAGLRCGYVVGSEELVRQIEGIRKSIPFSVNQIATAAAEAAIRDNHFVAYTVSQNCNVKQRFQDDLQAAGIPYIPSETNFVLVETPYSANLFCKAFEDAFGILVRDMTPLGLPNHIRVSIGTEKDMLKVAASLSYVFGKRRTPPLSLSLTRTPKGNRYAIS